MNIYEIKTENFKKLTAVQLTLDGKGVIITGKNGVGKSSLIDALFTTLTGKDLPTDPIQKGKDTAKNIVKIKQDDGTIITVEKTFKRNTTTLIVKTESGQKYSSPQKFLNELIGNITFDPFEFILLQPIEQKRFLMKLLGLDFTEIDNRKRKLLDEKDDISKEEIRLTKTIEKIPVHFNGKIPDKKDASEILKKQAEINAIENRRNAIKTQVENIHNTNLSLDRDISKIESEKVRIDATITSINNQIGDEQSECDKFVQNTLQKIEELKKDIVNRKIKAADKIEELEFQITENEKTIATNATTIKKINQQKEDNQLKIEELLDNYNNIEVPEFNGDALLKEIEEHNSKVDTELSRLELKRELSETEKAKRDKLDAINSIEQEKIEMINSVKMPVSGLSFADEGLTYEGMQLSEEQISKAKLIEIGVKIQMALNPNLKIMRIKDGSLLDSEMLSVIKKSCKENSYQLFIEKVSDDKEIGFIIEEETNE